MGRSTKLTTERLTHLCELLASADTLEECAHAANIGERTLHRWLEQGKEAPPGSKLARLRRAYNDSEAVLLNRFDRGDTEARKEYDADGNLQKTIEIKAEIADFRAAQRARYANLLDKAYAKLEILLDSEDSAIQLRAASAILKFNSG